jgi:hypothetical protein
MTEFLHSTKAKLFAAASGPGVYFAIETVAKAMHARGKG